MQAADQDGKFKHGSLGAVKPGEGCVEVASATTLQKWRRRMPSSLMNFDVKDGVAER